MNINLRQKLQEALSERHCNFLYKNLTPTLSRFLILNNATLLLLLIILFIIEFLIFTNPFRQRGSNYVVYIFVCFEKIISKIMRRRRFESLLKCNKFDENF